MNPIYNLGISAYKLAVRLAATRNKKARLMLEGHSRTLPTLRRRRKQHLDPRLVAWRI